MRISEQLIPSETHREANAAAFGSIEVVKAYDSRPGYPPEAIDYILKNALPPQDTESLPQILDAGAGNGLVTEGLLRNGRPAKVVALDISEPMMTAFKERIGDFVPPVVGAFEDTPFPDDSFDLIVFGSSLHWGDPERLPAELYRILRPGGSIANITNLTTHGSPFSEIMRCFPDQTSKFNPMTRTGLSLGETFSLEGQEMFPNDAEMEPDIFNRYLASISLFATAPSELSAAIRRAMSSYARQYRATESINVPTDAFVYIAKTRK